MEQYFIIQITKEKGSDVYATLITPKNDLNESKSLYHQICASVYASGNIEHAIIELKDFYGNIVLHEIIIPVILPEI